MRSMVLSALALMIVCGPMRADEGRGDLAQCADRNVLSSVAIDARLVAVKLYYEGFARGLADKDKRACYELKAVMDDKGAIINKTLDLIERNCLTLETAVRVAMQGVCP